MIIKKSDLDIWFVSKKETFNIPVPSPEKRVLIQPLVEANNYELIEPTSHFSQVENWDQDIIELETFYEKITLLTHTIKLNDYSTITNIPLFLEGHFATVKANNGKHFFLPYLHRLQELKQHLTK